MGARERSGSAEPEAHKSPLSPSLSFRQWCRAPLRRVAAREAASRLAMMPLEDQAAALFHSMGAHKKS